MVDGGTRQRRHSPLCVLAPHHHEELHGDQRTVHAAQHAPRDTEKGVRTAGGWITHRARATVLLTDYVLVAAHHQRDETSPREQEDTEEIHGDQRADQRASGRAQQKRKHGEREEHQINDGDHVDGDGDGVAVVGGVGERRRTVELAAALVPSLLKQLLVLVRGDITAGAAYGERHRALGHHLEARQNEDAWRCRWRQRERPALFRVLGLQHQRVGGVAVHGQLRQCELVAVLRKSCAL
mmetsp:Transcript_31375/g.78741  ORF Transcript_31375/g.78741 Transcript_31375/m.78741 type:complete len:239 (+) Transcript_31375:709-1425(+)